MKADLKHIEKITVAASPVVCAAAFFYALVLKVIPAQAGVKDARNVIEEALRENTAGGSSRYLRDKQLNYVDWLSDYLNGSSTPLLDGLQAFAFYPQLERPEVVQKQPDVGIAKNSKAVLLPAPERLLVEAQKGVRWQVTEERGHFRPCLARASRIRSSRQTRRHRLRQRRTSPSERRDFVSWAILRDRTGLL